MVGLRRHLLILQFFPKHNICSGLALPLQGETFTSLSHYIIETQPLFLSVFAFFKITYAAHRFSAY